MLRWEEAGFGRPLDIGVKKLSIVSMMTNAKVEE
jgi:hypothetical protein